MTYRATIEPLGETIEVAEGQRLLDAALRAGISLPYACNHGLCGTCKIDVIEGEVDHNDASSFALMDIERDEGKTLACCATLNSDIVIEADIEEEEDAAHFSVEDLRGEVKEIVDLTPTIRGLFIELEQGPCKFQAGQYLNLQVPGVNKPRAFSLANSPSSPRLELNVRFVEGGAATSWIHGALQVGDVLKFTAPLGRFFVRVSRPEPFLFLAGGSGLSSPKSMIEDLLERGETRPIVLIYGARSLDELYYVDHFIALSKRYANFEYIPAVSTPDPAWSGEAGFVHEVAARRFDGKFASYQAYLCGPPLMIDACLTTLMRGRCFEDQIFTEAFLSAADAEQQPKRSALFKKF